MRSRWLGFVIAALAAASSVWAYPRLPQAVATHWNFSGEPDGFASRIVAASLMPLVLFVLTAGLQLLPTINPKREHDAGFLRVYWLLVNGLMLFLGVIHVVLLANGIGAPVDPFVLMPLGLGLLLVLIGSLLGGVLPNATLGVRTPWTLASESIWRMTHRTAGWLLVLGGLVVMGTGLLQQVASLIVVFLTLTVVAVVPVVQLYVLWSRSSR